MWFCLTHQEPFAWPSRDQELVLVCGCVEPLLHALWRGQREGCASTARVLSLLLTSGSWNQMFTLMPLQRNCCQTEDFFSQFKIVLSLSKESTSFPASLIILFFEGFVCHNNSSSSESFFQAAYCNWKVEVKRKDLQNWRVSCSRVTWGTGTGEKLPECIGSL